MNASNAKDYLPLVQALAEGKEIEWMNMDDKWQVLLEPSFESDPSKYRIKPEPMEIILVLKDGSYGRRAYYSEDEAYFDGQKGEKLVKFREVIE